MSSSQRGRGRGGPSRNFNQWFEPISKHPQAGSSSKSIHPSMLNEKVGVYAEVLKKPSNPAERPIKKNVVDKVIYLSEKDRKLFGQPTTLAKQYLELDQEFPILNRKTREYYEAILKETSSMQIQHVNLNPGSRVAEIQFSKAFINGYVSLSDWGVNPNKPRILKFHQMEYNYWDYIDAWSKVFLYQNSYHTHSWWIRLDNFKSTNIDFKFVPHWFYNWLHYYGPEHEFLNKEFEDLYKDYTTSKPEFKDVKNPILNFHLFHFIGDYNIPWIFQWTYSVSSQNKLIFLSRDLYYKWWPKFETTDLLKKIKKDIEDYKKLNKSLEEIEKKQYISKLEQQEFKAPSLASLKKKFPDASPGELKKKMLEALACQIDFLNEEDFMSTSSKDQKEDCREEPSKSTEQINSSSNEENKNEDMEDYLGVWMNNLDNPDPIEDSKSSEEEFTLPRTRKNKGKNKEKVVIKL